MGKDKVISDRGKGLRSDGKGGKSATSKGNGVSSGSSGNDCKDILQSILCKLPRSETPQDDFYDDCEDDHDGYEQEAEESEEEEIAYTLHCNAVEQTLTVRPLGDG